jgi:hypothetical protein
LVDRAQGAGVGAEARHQVADPEQRRLVGHGRSVVKVPVRRDRWRGSRSDGELDPIGPPDLDPDLDLDLDPNPDLDPDLDPDRESARSAVGAPLE